MVTPGSAARTDPPERRGGQAGSAGASAGSAGGPAVPGQARSLPFGQADDRPPAGDEGAELPVRHPGGSAFGRRVGRKGETRSAVGGGPLGWPGQAGATGATGGHEGDELPRRVRQASLAVQLREAPPPERAGAARPAARPGERSPEQARATMAALRDGWHRGRDSAGSSDGASDSDSADDSGRKESRPNPGNGGARHLRLHQDPPSPARPPYDGFQDFEDFERSAADGRDDEPHR